MGPVRLRRSVLYMPGHNARALDKARSLPVDAVILDLEDAVAPDDKHRARGRVAEALHAGGYGHREVTVRVNDPSTDTGQADLQALAALPLDAVVVPKVESPDTLMQVDEQLRRLGYADRVQLWAMIETPRGVMDVERIAVAPRLSVLVMGTNDLCKELRVPQTPAREGLQYALGRCVMAARLYGRDILDGVHIHLDDEAGLAQACEQGRCLGFDGKTLIHPRQIDAVNRAFGPDDEAVARAEAVVTAWEAAGDQAGVVVVDGRLVEALHAQEARRVLQLAAALRERDDGQ